MSKMEKNNWEKHWLQGSKRNLLENIDNPKRWEDLSWKLGLEEWKNIFDKLAPGIDLLECGCGSATLSRYMARYSYNPTVLDYSKSSIQLAKLYFEQSKLNANYVIGDIKKLPFEDNSFDIVFSGGVLEYFDDYEIPISEMIRVLKPSGVFASNMVPRKFSIQTIADWQRTIAHSLKSLMHGDFNKILKKISLVPQNYNLNNANLKDYKNTVIKFGLCNVETRCTNPFPIFSFPPLIQKKYIQYLSQNLDLWRKFNSEDHFWKHYVGMGYLIFGVKKL